MPQFGNFHKFIPEDDPFTNHIMFSGGVPGVDLEEMIRDAAYGEEKIKSLCGKMLVPARDFNNKATVCDICAKVKAAMKEQEF